MAKSFEEQVNEVIANVETAEDGKWVLPEDLDEATRFAVMTEKRRRDTQTAYNGERQKNIAFEEELTQYRTQAEIDAVSRMSEEQQTELEELKHTDPESWRTRLNEIEQSNKAAFNEKATELTTKAKVKSEQARRQELLDNWVAENPDLQLDDSTIEDNIPPKFMKQLDKGEISFDEFLVVAKKYLSKGKTLDKGVQAPNEPDLSSVGGGSVPDDRSRQSALPSYQDAIF